MASIGPGMAPPSASAEVDRPAATRRSTLRGRSARDREAVRRVNNPAATRPRPAGQEHTPSSAESWAWVISWIEHAKRRDGRPGEEGGAMALAVAQEGGLRGARRCERPDPETPSPGRRSLVGRGGAATPFGPRPDHLTSSDLRPRSRPAPRHRRSPALGKVRSVGGPIGGIEPHHARRTPAPVRTTHLRPLASGRTGRGRSHGSRRCVPLRAHRRPAPFRGPTPSLPLYHPSEDPAPLRPAAGLWGTQTNNGSGRACSAMGRRTAHLTKGSPQMREVSGRRPAPPLGRSPTSGGGRASAPPVKVPPKVFRRTRNKVPP